MIHRIVLVLGHVLFVIALTVCSNPLERDVKENDTDADSFSPSNSNGELDLGNTSRIVGGNQADVGEYPYFVQSRGCGGVLIANEYVLTAAHCADITGSTMRVGAYKRNTLDNGAQQRTCRQYFDHPGFEFEGTCIGCFDFNAPFKLDFALCKLDKPVYVDDSKVELQLNRDNNFPAVDSKVTAVGLGTTSSGGFQATFLQEVDVEVDSNGDCAKASNPSIISDSATRTIYNSNSISQEIICASVPGGGKDSCQGDSGGPLVQRQTINGKRVDTHVGITSFGIGCAFEGLPGVYSRTSYGVEFINKIICIDGQSRSPFCQTQVTCNNISEKKLVIRVVTDFYPDEVSWTLTNAASGSTLRNRERNFYDQQFFTYEESICLKRSESFKFQIKDSYGDGLTFSSEGFFSLTVDGEQIAKNGDYGFEEIVEIRGDGTPLPTPFPTPLPTPFPTPLPTPPPTRPPTLAPVTPPVAVIINDSCKDDPNYIYTRPRDGKQFTCEKFLQGKRNKLRRKRCRKLDTARSSRRIKEFCPSYCLRKCRS